MINNAFQLTYNEGMKIHLIVTYTCNFSCTYCIVGKDPLKNETKGTYFSSENIQHLKDFIIKYIQSKSITVHIIGGEPFTNFPRLLEIVQNIINLNKIKLIYISTNGFFINASNLEALRDATLNYPSKFQLAFSIDGNPALMSTSNRVFQNKVIRNFELARDILGTDSVRIAMVIMPDSAKYFHKNIEYLFSLRPGLLEFALQKGCIWNTDAINTLIATFTSFIRTYFLNKELYLSTKFDIGINDTNNDMPCSKGKDHNITPEGYIIPCVSYLTSSDRDIAIFPHTLSEIINNNEFYQELLQWSEKYFLQNFNSELEVSSRIDYAHCIRSGIKDNDSFNDTKKNLKRFDYFRSTLISKLIKESYA